jgi:hypothetical protein
MPITLFEFQIGYSLWTLQRSLNNKVVHGLRTSRVTCVRVIQEINVRESANNQC